MDDFWSKIVNILVGQSMALPEDIIGCTDEEIEELKKAQGVSKLPKEYVNMLKRIGKSTGGTLFSGEEEYFCEWAIHNKKKAHWILEDERKYFPERTFSLPDDAFVFDVHHDYVFGYFLTKDSKEDPLLYWYMKGGFDEEAPPVQTLTEHMWLKLRTLCKVYSVDLEAFWLLE